jgi:hypothetical protein
MPVTIGISDFARERHTPDSGKTYFKGPESDLLGLIFRAWHWRSPGQGEKSLDRKIVVPLPPDNFGGLTNVVVAEDTILEARLEQRQLEEAPFIAVKAIGYLRNFGTAEFHDPRIAPLPEVQPIHASAVLYSAEALLENGGNRSTDCDWEVVALIASDVPNEPMHPLVIARNMLELVGGTKSTYTAEEFARSIVYWSTRCGIDREQYG